MYKMKMSNLRIASTIAIALLMITAVIAVMPATATAAVSVTRDLPDAVYQGEEFNVSLTQSGFSFGAGKVTETLPEGFEYVLGSLPSDKSDYDEATNNLTIEFWGDTTITYVAKAGTAEQIENAVFSGTWRTVDSQLNKINGSVGGDTTLGEKPTPPATATPPSGNGGGNGGGDGGGIPPTPPAGTPAYIALGANPADIPADGISTSRITASVWDGEDWVLENLTVNFSTSLGSIIASAVIANGTATAILTAGMEEGAATITAEAILSGDIGIITITNTTAVNFTIPGATPTPTVNVTLTPTVTVSPTPAATVSPTPSPTKEPLIPGFEAVFAIASLFSVAYLVLRRRRGE